MNLILLNTHKNNNSFNKADIRGKNAEKFILKPYHIFAREKCGKLYELVTNALF